MPYVKETEMYPHVMAWLERFLLGRYRRKQIIVRDTSRRALKRVLEEEGLMPANKPEWATYDIHVDVTGFIVAGSKLDLAFVECKTQAINLRHISQLLGYSRVALPVYSCVVSSGGVSGDILSLLRTHSRYDVLQYDWPNGETPRSIVVATWNESRRDIDYNSLLPLGHPSHNPAGIH